MPFSPTPVLPGTSPLPAPGQQPPSKRALRTGALITLPILVLSLVVGQLFLNRLLFLLPSLQAQAGIAVAGAGSAQFQGFVYTWTRRDRDANSGYTSPTSLKNMQSEAKDFHMNTVVIPVVADMPLRNDSYIAWHNKDRNDVDTLPEGDYVQAIKDAQKAGLTPILELQVHQQDVLRSQGDESGSLVGTSWSDSHSSDNIANNNGALVNVGKLERAWFDTYTAFAVHYAQLSAQNHLPFFIIGNDLVNVSYDTTETNAKNDPRGIDRNVPGDSCPQDASGRRECEWRHVVTAIRAQTYSLLSDHKKSASGGGYTGKLIYAANWSGASDGGLSDPEFEKITWWDAVDFIGVDAYFPLTQNQLDPPLDQLIDAWHGKGTSLGLPSKLANIYDRLGKVAATFDRSLVFTAAGYASVPSSNSAAFQTSNVTSSPDQAEQANDMRALLLTFSDTVWWSGVFWSADRPIPRDKQPNWAVNSGWAGPTLPTSKQAGQWLASYYKTVPVPTN
ncbi:MAG TPA: hypothetical protein VFU88_20050 [Ktedonobacterales bacterium]|nr:hypothetical protein [Ktedonobacterales bacterium]